MAKSKKDKIGAALLKVALGCTACEVTEEYAEVDGQLKLTKRRETKKDIPPDLKAVQMLIGDRESDFSAMTDEELLSAREKLLEELEKVEQKKGGNVRTGGGKVGGKVGVRKEKSKDKKGGTEG